MEELKERGQTNKRKIEQLLKWLDLSEFVTYSTLTKNVFFFFFIIALGVLHVANTHRAERMIRNINKKEKAIKQLRWEYMSKRADLMYESKQSELAQKLEGYDIKESVVPPEKIELDRRAY